MQRSTSQRGLPQETTDIKHNWVLFMTHQIREYCSREARIAEPSLTAPTRQNDPAFHRFHVISQPCCNELRIQNSTDALKVSCTRCRLKVRSKMSSWQLVGPDRPSPRIPSQEPLILVFWHIFKHNFGLESWAVSHQDDVSRLFAQPAL